MSSTRVFELMAVFVVVAAAIVLRLYHLQVDQHEFWENESLKARTSSRSLPARRGAILDRQGRPIAKSESSYDLEFHFREFRKQSRVGQLLLAHFLRTGQRVAVAELLADPGPFLEPLQRMTVGEYRRLEPRMRRRDLLVYLAWLIGDASTEFLAREADSASDADLLVARLAVERSRIEDRIWEERAYLAELETALEMPFGELAERIDAGIAWTDAQVLQQLKARGETDRAFEVERALHANYDDRVRLLVPDVPHQDFFHVEVEEQRLGGLSLQERTRRIYPPEGDACAVLIGTVGSPWEEDLAATADRWRRLAELRVDPLSHQSSQEIQELQERLRRDDYREGEEVGRFGLELLYESALRGRRGWLKDIADVENGGRRVLESVPAENGRDLHLSLDAPMQQAAVQALEQRLHGRGWCGAFVLLELPEVKIRVLASCPERGRDAVEVRGLAPDPDERHPLADQDWRAYAPLHPEAWRPFFPPPPGSVIKPLIGAFALAEGVVDGRSRLLCQPGSLVANGIPVRCLGTHGEVELRTALVRSCNHYFARISGTVGYERMFQWCEDFGFGRRTDFAQARLPSGEHFEGLVPSEIPAPLSHEGMTERNLLLFGIGQGQIDDVTPLTVAAAMAALAQRRYRPPVLIERVGDETPLRTPARELPIPRPHWLHLVAAMRGVTADADGTANDPAQGLDLSAYDLATKTGTPQIAGSPDHSWFAGFFPAEAPRYAFAVFMAQTGLHGGEACAPVLQELLAHPAFAEVEECARRSDS